ncbi:response regulator [Paenibacillus mesotrionivorans]|uniref:Response regulator n=1 Tax=Paenibacillus mesotrionivorans TaxID=3160968 RepID=A0ACC7P6J4_9BACL
MRLLVVDDEPVIRNGLKKMALDYPRRLESADTAGNGLEALAKIEESEPDILLTDIRMPRMDGLELCRQVHERYPHIMKIVISGYSDFDYAQKCMDYGVKHYLLKPVTPPDLHEVLDKLVHSGAPGFIPASRYLGWIGRLEEAVWSLQEEEIGRLAEEWREHGAGLSVQQLKELLEDVLAQLERNFREKSRPVPSGLAAPLGGHSRQEFFTELEDRLKACMTGLLAQRRGNFKDPMEEAKAYIDSHLSLEISLKEVADMVGITPTYFSALFKKITNETFISYRIHRRMEKARELLAVPHMRTVDIAAEVGYDDYPHFTKTFKKIYGQSPSEYRASLGIK